MRRAHKDRTHKVAPKSRLILWVLFDVNDNPNPGHPRQSQNWNTRLVAVQIGRNGADAPRLLIG
jgi:hypothetical protein